MTVYAKQVDKHRSSVLVGEDRVDTEFTTLSINPYLLTYTGFIGSLPSGHEEIYTKS
jgi:hypothetical protein